MTYEDLQARFPEMTPLKAAPSLSTYNGFGMTLHGRHNPDPETGTYVATRWFSALFIPLVALSSYRVAAAPEGGWFFLGRVPLRSSLKKWNLAFLLLLLAGGGGIAWFSDYNSPASKAERRIADADRLAAEGHAKEAAERYQKEFSGPKAAQARERLKALMNNLPENGEEAAGALQLAVDLQRRNQSPCDDAGKIGMQYAVRRGADDPAAALAVLEVAAPLVVDQAAVAAKRRSLLESLVASNPSNLSYLSRLAEICEDLGDSPRAEQLLLPVEAKLAAYDGDGAAILGRILAAKGEYDRAYRLLKPFVEARVAPYQAAESAYRKTFADAQDRIIGELDNGKAEGFDYNGYERSGKEQQSAMVGKYLNEKIESDSACRKARQNLAKHRNVLPAVLDLGIVMLARAQKAADPAARQRELQAAEALFLSMRDHAAGSDVYQLKLAQAKYWLGKSAEGRKIIDELLAASPAPNVVIEALRVLREVGADDEARKLCEACYAREAQEPMKYAFANFRTLLSRDLDDKIEWLSKCDPSQPEVKASSAYCRGLKAKREGRKDDAVRELRQSIKIYEEQREDASTLNNAALSLIAVHEITGDAADFLRAADKLDRAVALESTDSILLVNTISLIQSSILREIVDNGIDTIALGVPASYDMLGFLYRDKAGYDAVYQRFRKHPGTTKLRNYSEKLVLLAPQNAAGYATLNLLGFIARDETAMNRLLEQTKAAGFDHRDSVKESLDPQREAKTAADHERSVADARRVYDTVKTRRDATFAFAAGLLAENILRGQHLGKPVDSAAVLKLAEEAHAAAPSGGTMTMLEEALIYRLHEQLQAADGEYAKLAKSTRRWFGSEILEIALSRSEPLKVKAMALPEMKRYCGLLADKARSLPDSIGPVTVWMLLQADPDVGQAAKAHFQANRLRQLTNNIVNELSPPGVQLARTEYFTLLVENDPNKAKAVWTKLRSAGYPVPDWDK